MAKPKKPKKLTPQQVQYISAATAGPPKGVPAQQRYGNTLTAPGVQPPAPDVGGRPLDWQEEQARLMGGRNLALSNADAAYQTGVLQQEYGYGDAGASNPYSRAALLEESYKRSKLGTTNSYASQGQLYSGAYGRMQGENARNYSIGVDQNRRGFDQAMYGVRYGQAQNTANYGTGMDDAAFEALMRQLRGG